MFETFMHPGAYRIDYFNGEAMGRPDAIALYVLGNLPEQAAYSNQAKRNLVAGLSLIQKEIGKQNLVAVYIDINTADNLARPAYQQMKWDIRLGVSHQIMVHDMSDLAIDSAVMDDLNTLYREVGGFKVITYHTGVCRCEVLDFDCYPWIDAERRAVYEPYHPCQ